MSVKLKDDGDIDLFSKYREEKQVESLSELMYERDKEFSSYKDEPWEGMKLFQDD
ncbi:hypothetical protein [Synechococcus phage BUCT-ZZ01]|nr:hypothetical protein [Synechococcus phage BUCT-ZZ01]